LFLHVSEYWTLTKVQIRQNETEKHLVRAVELDVRGDMLITNSRAVELDVRGDMLITNSRAVEFDVRGDMLITNSAAILWSESLGA
jgi:hypothetical protein